MASLALAFDILAKDKASKTLNDVGDSVDKTGKKVGKLGPAMKAGMAAAGVAVAAFGKASVSAFVEAEQSSARLDAALAKFPKTADVTRKSFDDLNASLARKTKFDDDATASGQAVLAQFNLTGQQIQSVTPLLQDYAAATGRDLPTAASTLGKAMMGNTRALKEIGINYKSTGDAGRDFTNIQALLSQKVGGFAEREGKTAAGQAAILRNQFGEVQEEVGSRLVPVLTQLAGVLLKTIDFVQRNRKVIVPLVAVLGGFAAAVWAVSTAAKAYTAVQAALNVVMALNPIGLVVVAIAALVAGFVLAYKKSETFRNIVNTLWDVLKKFVGFTPLGALIKNFTKIRDLISEVLRKIKDLIGKLKDLPGVDSLGKIAGLAGKLPGFGFSRTVARARDSFGSAVYGRMSFNPNARLDASQVNDTRRGGETLLQRRRRAEEQRRRLFTANSRTSGGLSIGQIIVNSGPREDASISVPRALRNLAFTAGMA